MVLLLHNIGKKGYQLFADLFRKLMKLDLDHGKGAEQKLMSTLTDFHKRFVQTQKNIFYPNITSMHSMHISFYRYARIIEGFLNSINLQIYSRSK
ncbi:MAG: hypothetical protein B9S32_13230 [Verrucomicrobia bacterium Tous-C9LFEB]|nr:MAG: hypothetical protein B9S32_13230 [Verrucomicrobia bacterium Tous-C9LFEB]